MILKTSELTLKVYVIPFCRLFYLFQSIGFINPPLSVCYINLVDFDTLTDVKRSIIRLITRTMKVGNASF